MGTTRRTRIVGLLAALSLAAAACGGSGNADESPTDTNADSAQPGTDQPSTDDSDTPDQTATGQAVNGALVSVLDIGLGLYGIDRDTGKSFELAYEENWFTDRNNAPFVVGDRAYTLVFREVDDLDFVNETSVAEFDLATGQGREVIAFGANSESSESFERTTWELIGAGGDALWLRRSESDTEGSTTQTVERYSIATGERAGEVSNEGVVLTTDEGATCTSAPRPIGVGSDGTLYVSLGGIPGRVDNDTFDVVEIIPVCFNEDLWLSRIAGLIDLAEFTIVDNDTPVPAEQTSFLYDDEPEISNDSALVTDDAIWWVFSRTPSFTDDADEQRSAIVGGVARLDLATGGVSAFPIGDNIGEFLDRDETGFSLSAMSQVDLQFVGGSLWLMDHREAQPLHRLDPTTGNVTQFEIPVGEGNDFVDAELIPTDPDAIWLSVTRRMITSAEGENRSTTGTSFVDQVDPETGKFVRAISEGELTGFGN